MRRGSREEGTYRCTRNHFKKRRVRRQRRCDAESRSATASNSGDDMGRAKQQAASEEEDSNETTCGSGSSNGAAGGRGETERVNPHGAGEAQRTL